MRRSGQVGGAPSRGARAARELTVGAALVLALGGCSGSPEEVVRTSGALADGFEIEAGSGLVGAVFPVALPYGGGHQAVLRVDGDARRVFEGYVRQAEDLGYSFESGLDPDGQWCSDPRDETTGDEPAGPFEAECSTSGSRQDEWRVSLGGLVEPDGQGYIHLSTGLYSDAPRPVPLEPDGPAAPATDDEVAPDLAPPEGDPPLRVVEGSELITDPFPSGCSTGGYIAVLQVTGELMPVMRGYERQFTDTTPFTSGGLVGDDDEPRIVASAAGGGTLTAVGVAGDPSYVLVERCND